MLAPCRAGPYCPGGGQGGTGHQRRRVVHALEYRIVLGAQAESQRRRARFRAARLPDRGDVAPQVHRLQLPVGGWRRALDRHSGRREQAEGAGQLDRQLDPHRRQRVAGPEVVTREPVIPGNMQRTGHTPLKHGAELPAIFRPLPALPASRWPGTFPVAARSRPRPILVRVKKPGRLHWPSRVSMVRGLSFSGRARS
jgi:hypothetical protein